MSLVLNACRNYTLKINIEIYSYHVKQKVVRSIKLIGLLFIDPMKCKINKYKKQV